jgi:hypothetical protein
MLAGDADRKLKKGAKRLGRCPAGLAVRETDKPVPNPGF